MRLSHTFTRSNLEKLPSGSSLDKAASEWETQMSVSAASLRAAWRALARYRMFAAVYRAVAARNSSRLR